MFDEVLSMFPVVNIPGFSIAQDFSMSQVLNVPEFRIYQSSEYASGFEYARILHIPEFWICQGYTGFRICLNKSWICLSMPDNVWICLGNMPEYVRICVNIPKYAWMAFGFTFLHFPIGFTIPWKRGYLFERLQETRETTGYSLKEHETVFLKKQNLTFSLAAGSISFVFCFRLLF